MTKAVRVHKVGGPEALVYESDRGASRPDAGEVRIRQHAVGLNFIDVYYRTGLYKAPGLPFIAGNEAAGEVAGGRSGRHQFSSRRSRRLLSQSRRLCLGAQDSLRTSWSNCPTTSPMSRAPC